MAPSPCPSREDTARPPARSITGWIPLPINRIFSSAVPPSGNLDHRCGVVCSVPSVLVVGDLVPVKDVDRDDDDVYFS